MGEADWIALGSIAGLITALATVAMAVAIIVTAVFAKHTLEETRADSRARTRPVIVAELRRELLSRGTTLLALTNLGESVAKDVAITFDPPPPEGVESLPNDNMLKWIYQRYQTSISTWAPGWAISNVIRTGEDGLEPITVTARYTGPDGTTYDDSYALHPDHILKETSSSPSKASDPIELEQQKVSALHALVRTLRDR